MTDVLKKYILNLCSSDLSDQMNSILEQQEVEIVSKFDETQKYDFVLIDSDDTQLPCTCAVIFIGEPKNRSQFFKNNGKAIISKEMTSDTIESIIFDRLLGNSSSLSLEKAFDSEIDSCGSFKVTDHLNGGYYSDLVAAKAVVNDFDFLRVRNSFFNLVNFFSVIIDSKKGLFPVDVDFGISDEKFIIQSHFNVMDFGGEYLWSSLSPKGDKFLHDAVEYVDTLDCYILEKTGRLVVTLVISKDPSSMKNIFLHNVKSFKLMNVEDLVGGTTTTSVEDLPADISLAEKTQHISKVKNILEDDQMSDGHLVNVTRVVKFLKKTSFTLDDLSLDNFSTLVKGYPNEAVLDSLTINDKKLIIDSLKDEEKFSNLESSLEEVEKIAGLDEFLDSLVTKIDGLSLEQANEIVTLTESQDADEEMTRVGGWKEEEDNHKEVIKGSPEDLGEVSTMVKGSKEDLTEDRTIISGSPEKSNNDSVTIKGTPEDTNKGKFTLKKFEGVNEWSSKKDDIISGIRKRAEELKNKGASLSDLGTELTTIVSESLDIDIKDSSSISKGLFENASEKFVTSVKHESKSEQDNSEEVAKLRADLIKRDTQLGRMMKLIEGMKKELVSKKQVISSPTDDTFNVELNKLKAEVDKRDKQIDLLKKNLENTHGVVDKINSITDQNNELLDTVSVEPDIVKNLEDEVKRLTSQLSLAQGRIESISEKADSEKEMADSRSNNESKLFREKFMKSQEIINKFQDENKSLEKELFELKRVKEELENKANLLASNDHSEELKEKDQALAELSKVSKQNEDRYRAAGLRIKQLEQKNKFLTAQVSEATKKAKKGSGAGAKGAVDPKTAHKIKQLERLTEKLKGSSDKFEEELTAKKKEVHQSKLENNTLKLKIDELERKISKLDKQAA
ncbi:hypothetical protein [Halobacteriovorax sp. HLS]|uniref:hypothetical protein n=1 Tax=Halobacteriovorax sp. HLS TaxID=2234000 RepID=UPI000FDC3EF7|nr:hypothetical protein [Halobacteriovorax sp. HLS]